ncbi:MAG: hypothetical protein ABUT39_07170 [Acidobacteriota bacterium]
MSLLSLVSLSAPACGLEPYLVKDINPVAAAAGSSPSNFTSLGGPGGVAVFTAFGGESGLGLWRSDGTAAGTWKLADVCAAWPACGWIRILAVEGGRAFLQAEADLWVTDGSVAGTLRLTDGLELGDVAWVPEQRALYFVGTDPAHGAELWRTDGTPAGTHLVADLARGPESARIRTLTAFRGRVWFAALLPGSGGGIWSSDGTARGTVPVRQGGDAWSLPWIHGVVGRRLLFEQFSGREEAGLWTTDGTKRGTAQVLRLRDPIWSPVIQNGRLFFVAVNPGHGQELWVSDGTARGTRVVSDIPGKEAFVTHGDPRSPLLLPRTSLPGLLLFQAWDPAHGVELWSSDGTPAGTRLVRDVCPGPCSGADHVLLSNQGLFYFAGTDGIHGVEPWASDGTPEGTRMVRDLCPGEYGSILYSPSRFAGRLLFAANDCASGWQLWKTDGTAAGTLRVTDFDRLVPVDSYLGAAAGGRFLFAGDDEHGSEPWSTDGTIAGTAPVADLDQADFGGSMVGGIRALGDEAIFFADDGLHGYELWKSDGTAAGTGLLAELSPGPEPPGAPAVIASAEAGGKLFLVLYRSEGISLWRTDGTAAGTFELLGRDDSPPFWDGSGLCAVGGTVFFTSSGGDFGRQIWATDGTVAGTRQAVESEPGKAFSDPTALTEMGGRLYFFAAGADGLWGLWRSDGAPPALLKAVRLKTFDRALPEPAVHAGRLWFLAGPPGGNELWSSDGTAAGTRPEPLPGLPLLIGFMASTGAKLMISGYEPGRGEELWATDGTPAGTVKVGPALYDVPGFPWTVFRGRLVYAVDERFDGHPKLWTSDGTAAGTGPLLDRDGKPIPPPVGLAVLGGSGGSGGSGDRLIFTTGFPAREQVWESDGTPAGTGPIAPERAIGYNTGAVGRAGSRVFFGAWDPATGQELWAVEESHP